jgi:hypothetical protein
MFRKGMFRKVVWRVNWLVEMSTVYSTVGWVIIHVDMLKQIVLYFRKYCVLNEGVNQ